MTQPKISNFKPTPTETKFLHSVLIGYHDFIRKKDVSGLPMEVIHPLVQHENRLKKLIDKVYVGYELDRQVASNCENKKESK